jgi:RNA polymerase sigma-70 factor, ECF subfamily
METSRVEDSPRGSPRPESPLRPVRRGSRDDGVEGDVVLMERVATADRGAMHILFSRHHLAVYRFVLQRVQDRMLAEDVTSEVFLDVWRHADRFEGRSAVLTWILAIARHKTLAARAKFRLRFDPGAAASGHAADELHVCDVEVPLQVRDRQVVLRKCMTRLSAEHREVIDLVYYQEQSLESVATILGIPRGTAKTRVFYARKRLADELKKSGVDHIAQPRHAIGCCRLRRRLASGRAWRGHDGLIRPTRSTGE